MITKKENYLVRVQLAQDGDDLRGIHADLENDDRLHITDKDEISEAIKARYGEMNAQAAPEQKPRWEHKREPIRTCKHLIAILICAVLALAVFADSASQRAALVPTAIGQSDDPLTCSRLAALSMIESGDNDNAIGKAGEVSRYQIMPDVFAQYFFVVKPPADVAAFRMAAGARNAFTARNVAKSIMRDRCRVFATRFHRQPSDFEFYILWARPSWLKAGFTLLSFPANRVAVTERARRFANLVNR